MIPGFSYNVYVPSLHENVRYSELTNKMYMCILKYIQNDDDDGLELLLEHYIHSLCLEPDRIRELDRLDKYCVLMTIIMMSIGNTLQYTIQCDETDKEYTIDISVGSVITKINDLNTAALKVDLSNENHIYMSSPQSIRGVTSNTISRVCMNGVTYDTTDMSTEQLNQLLENLPYNIFNALQQTYEKLHQECNEIVYFEYRTPYVKDAAPVQYRFNLYNDDFFRFIKLLLREDLLSYYKMYYALTTKFKFDMTYIQSITPTETKMYLSMVRDDIKKKQEQTSQQTTSNNLPVSTPIDTTNS